MRIKKTHLLVSTLAILLAMPFAIALLGHSNIEQATLTKKVGTSTTGLNLEASSSQPAACEGSCSTSGETCCWNTASGSKTNTCTDHGGGSLQWGPATSCGHNRDCSSVGVGGECQSNTIT